MAKRKFHINPETGEVGPCGAQEGGRGCPFATAENPNENHFLSMAAANKARDTMMAEKFGSLPSASKAKKMTARERALEDLAIKRAREKLERRARTGEVSWINADPALAKQRLDEAIDYASSHKNTILARKLSNAVVLPSGTFVTKDGLKVDVDDILYKKQVIDFVAAGHKKILGLMADAAREGRLRQGNINYSSKRAGGDFGVKVSYGFNKEEFEKLPDEIQKQILEPTKTLSIARARKVLTQEQQNALISFNGQVADGVIGDSLPFDTYGVTVPDKLEGDTPRQKIDYGLRKLARFHKEVTQNWGHYNVIREDYDEMVDAVKEASGTETHGTFFFLPASSTANGVLLSARESFDRNKAESFLSGDELDAITVKSTRPSTSKAEDVLTKAQFKAVYSKPSVTLKMKANNRQTTLHGA